MSPSEARKRARQIYIESHGQADYDEIKLTLRLEGLGDHETRSSPTSRTHTSACCA
jgi:hypothetical protein